MASYIIIFGLLVIMIDDCLKKGKGNNKNSNEGAI